MFAAVSSSSVPQRTVVNNNFEGSIKSISITPDGEYIAVGTTNNLAYLLSKSGEIIWSKKVSGNLLHSISISSDGNYVIAAMGDGFYYVDKYENRLFQQSASSLAYSTFLNTNGEYLAVGSGYTVYMLHDYGVKKWEYVRDSYITGSVVSSVALTSNSDYLVAGSKDMHVYFFRCNNSYLNYLWRYNVSSFVYSVSISPKGDYVAVGAGSGIFLIDKNGDLLWERKPGNSINSVSISSDERYIAVSAGSGIYLYNTKGDLLWKDNYPSSIDSVIVSPKSNYILVGSGKVLYKQDINDDSNGNGESTNRLNNGRYVLNPNLINIQGNKSNSWWIDPYTGNPNVVIVVGAGAPDENVRTAKLLATAIINNGNSKIESIDIIKLDIEFNSVTNNKNVILLGGPVDNSIVKDLVDMGVSTVDWATSRGEWEWIADPFAKGYDILIISGPEEGVLARNGQFVVREVLPVPVSKTAPTQEYYFKRTMVVEDSFYNLPDKDGDGVPDKYDNNPNGSGGSSYTYFSWDDNGQLRTWELEAPYDYINFYDKARPQYDSVAQWTKFIVPNDKVSEILSKAFNKISNGYTEEEKVSLVLKFVQKLEYKSDDTITRDNKFFDYPRYPTQTLFDRTGDCEDTSILLAALLNEMGKDVSLIHLPDHMATGVYIPKFNPNYSAYYYTLSGKEYYYCETTAKGWKIGQIPEEYINATARIYEID